MADTINMTKPGLWDRSKRRLKSYVARTKLRIAAALIRSTNDSEFSEDDYDSDEYDDDDSDDSDDDDEDDEDDEITFSRRISPAPVCGAARNDLLWPSDKRQLKVRFLNSTTQEKDYVKQLVNKHIQLTSSADQVLLLYRRNFWRLGHPRPVQRQGVL